MRDSGGYIQRVISVPSKHCNSLSIYGVEVAMIDGGKVI